MKLRPVSYNWKSDEANKGRVSIGLIAQEVLPIIPEIVDAGNGTTDIMGIAYLELIPILIKSIQEQQKLIDDQQMQISNLEAEHKKNATIKADLEQMKGENESLIKRLDSIEEFMRHLKTRS